MTEQVVDISTAIEKYADSLTEQQLRALPLLGFGMNHIAVSQQLNVAPNLILTWLRADHVFMRALAVFRQYQEDYHKQQLNKLSALAWGKLETILTSEFDTNDKENRKLQMDAIKHVTGMLNLREEKLTIEHRSQEDNLETSSIDILAKRLSEKNNDEIIDGKYTVSVIDVDEPENTPTSMRTAEKVSQQHDLPDETKQLGYFKYIIHPDARPGTLTIEDGKFLCHICGQRMRDLVVHIRNEHQLSPARYREMYMLSPDTKFMIEQLTEATDNDIEKLAA